MITDHTELFAIDLLAIGFIMIFILPISMLAGIKRFHDIDYNGWTILLLFVPVINIGGSFLLLFKDGTIGTNRFGDDPKKRQPKINVNNEVEDNTI